MEGSRAAKADCSREIEARKGCRVCPGNRLDRTSRQRMDEVQSRAEGLADGVRAKKRNVYVSVRIEKDTDSDNGTQQMSEDVHCLIVSRTEQTEPAASPGIVQSQISCLDMFVVLAPVLEIVPSLMSRLLATRASVNSMRRGWHCECVCRAEPRQKLAYVTAASLVLRSIWLRQTSAVARRVGKVLQSSTMNRELRTSCLSTEN